MFIENTKGTSTNGKFTSEKRLDIMEQIWKAVEGNKEEFIKIAKKVGMADREIREFIYQE